MVANTSGRRVSFMPRSEPAAMVWMPSATKKVDPTSSNVADSSAAASVLSPRKIVAIPNRPRITASVRAAPMGKPVQCGPQSRAPHPSHIAAADAVSDPHRGDDADAERHQEQDRGDLQRDLMLRQR